MEAALGLAQLETWQEMIAQRQLNAQYLIARMNGDKLFEHLQLPKVQPWGEHSWMEFPLVCMQAGVRDRLTTYLNEWGVETRTMLPLTNQPVYKDLFNEADYSVAAWINRNGFYIGVHQGLCQTDLDYVVDKIKDFFK